MDFNKMMKAYEVANTEVDPDLETEVIVNSMIFGFMIAQTVISITLLLEAWVLRFGSPSSRIFLSMIVMQQLQTGQLLT